MPAIRPFRKFVMSEEPSTRDVLATILYLAGAILLLCAFAPFRVGLLVAGVTALVAGYVIAIYKFAAMSGAFMVLGARFIWLYVVGRDPKMLAGGVVSLTCVYIVFRLNPESAGPLSYKRDANGRPKGKK